MAPRLRSALILTLTGLALAACTSVPRGAFDARDGWREGRIERIAPYASLRARPGTDCAVALGIAPEATVAIVRYRHHGDFGSAVMPLADPTAWAAGDRVYLQPDQCAAPLARRLPDAP